MSEGASVLVVDDDPVTRQMLSGTLEERGHRVTTADDGRRGLDLVRSERFDVVLLDVLMPHLNGYDVLEHMKGDEELRHIPVVMVTSVDEVESAVRCIELGADDYLRKPFAYAVLLARIRALLRRADGRPIAETLAVRYPAEVAGHLNLGIAFVQEGRFLEALEPLGRVVDGDHALGA